MSTLVVDQWRKLVWGPHAMDSMHLMKMKRRRQKNTTGFNVKPAALYCSKEMFGQQGFAGFDKEGRGNRQKRWSGTFIAETPEGSNKFELGNLTMRWQVEIERWK